MTNTLHWLEDDPSWFPHVSQALSEPSGLLAVGGDLSAERLINAYSKGIFPWFSQDEPILWWSPDPRSILHPDHVHCSRSLKKFMNKTPYVITINQAFREVISHCSGPRANESGTWITSDMKKAYATLNELGWAHSVEAWHEGELVGGLYGVSIGGAFFGESMFSRLPNASKVAFVTLCQQLSRWGFELVDCQVHNPYLGSMGAAEVPRSEFLTILDKALDVTAPEVWCFDRQ